MRTQDPIIYKGEIPNPPLAPRPLEPPTSPVSLPAYLPVADRMHHTLTACKDTVWIFGGYTHSTTQRGALAHPISFSRAFAPETIRHHTFPELARRWGHSATCLPQGDVVIFGGSEEDPELSPFRIAPPRRFSVQEPNRPVRDPKHDARRIRHTATLLRSGELLLAGGLRDSEHTLNTTAIYDPVREAWTQTPPMRTARFDHTATRLKDGRVLVVGGRYGAGCDGTCVADCLEDEDCAQGSLCSDEFFCTRPQSSTELYAPAKKTWTPIPTEETDARFGHTATLLQTGEVLVVGGRGQHTSALNNLLFQPRDMRWILAGQDARTERSEHTATLLPNGHVLFVGGAAVAASPPHDHRGRADRVPLASCVLYKPVDRSWHTCPSLRYARRKHRALLSSKGEVLVWGGVDAYGYTIPSAELFDPKTQRWSVVKGSAP